MAPEPITYQRAAQMRRALTPPEARLWTYLKAGRLNGLRFRRQHPIGPYILDFYCRAARTAVEIDGAHHFDPAQHAHDTRRTAWLNRQNIQVLRYPATDIRDRLDAVLTHIFTRISQP